MVDDLFTTRKNLAEICTVPEKIISVYSLEKHVWADSNSEASRKARKSELQTIEEFQIDPVRPFLTDIPRNMAAPWKRERKDNPVGQGYWIQAEFGSGKSHLLIEGIESASSAPGNLPERNAKNMKGKSKGEIADELRPEYDLSTLLKDGVRGKYAKSYEQGSNLVLLSPDVAEAFPTDEAVNEALRLVIQLKRIPEGKKRRVPVL